MSDIDIAIVRGNGLVQDTPTSPLQESKSNLHFGFNPPMVASVIRDTLRFLFETGAPDRLKYNREPKQSEVVISLTLDDTAEEAEQSKPRISVDRGPYTASGIGLTDSMTSGLRLDQANQSIRDEFMNMVSGNCSIKIIAYNKGVCEELAYLVMTFLVWSRPMITNTLGFKNLASPISASPLMQDKDDKDKFVIELNVPYVTEMRWMSEELGTKLKGFLLEFNR